MTSAFGSLERVLGDLGRGRLAIRMPNWLGDAMFAIPAVRRLRRMAPKAVVELYARPPVAEVLRAFADVGDRVISAGISTPTGVWNEAHALRGAAASVLFPNSFVSAIPPWLGRVPFRFGLATDGRRPLLTHRRPRTGGLPQAEYYLAAIGQAGPVTRDDARVTPRLSKNVADESAAFAVLVPGAAFGSAKRWTEAGFIDVGRGLRSEGLEIIVLGSRGEAALAGRVALACGGTSLAGQTNGADFVNRIAGASVAVVNDSGALHLAVALGTPVVAIYGATDPASTGPITGAWRVLYRPVDCSPCGLRVCARPTHECMAGVTSSAVLESVRDVRQDGDT